MITIAKGDKGYNLGFTVTDDLGVVKDLTGYTVKLKMWAPGVPGTLVINGTCVVDSAALGTCHYVIGSTDLATAGRYSAELELTTLTVTESTELFTIIIKESG